MPRHFPSGLKAASFLGGFSLVLVPLSLVLAPLPRAAAQGPEAAADEVKWRSDYNAARREAQDKGKPLVIDFGTEHCLWCKRLDATTFHDAAVVKAMNTGFVPLRIDAEKEASLANILRIQNYPTIVIAGPDGKILVTREGYLEADRFMEQLQRVLAVVSNPEWMTRDYQEAVKAITGSDYARAIALLRSVTEDGKNRSVQVKSRQLLKDLEQQAAGRLARAKQLSDKGQTSEAIDTLTELLRVFSGTQAADDAGQMLTALGSRQEIKGKQRARRAREVLAQAREDYRTQQYVCCMDRCEMLSASYGDLPEGEEARQLLREIKSNPDWIQNACENLSDRLGSLYLDLADSWLKKGQPQQAVMCLKRVVGSFPSTRQAEIAQVRLAQIQGRQPTRQTNFKKP
jgi:thioredoxin-like negative regulator of GroEL